MLHFFHVSNILVIFVDDESLVGMDVSQNSQMSTGTAEMATENSSSLDIGKLSIIVAMTCDVYVAVEYFLNRTIRLAVQYWRFAFSY